MISNPIRIFLLITAAMVGVFTEWLLEALSTQRQKHF